MMTGFGAGFGALGLLTMVLFWGLLIGLAVLVIRAVFPGSTHSTSPSAGHTPTARDLLDQRYARGEITREQYDTMKQDIAGR